MDAGVHLQEKIIDNCEVHVAMNVKTTWVGVQPCICSPLQGPRVEELAATNLKKNYPNQMLVHPISKEKVP